MGITLIACTRTQECDPELALKIKHERFRWHNFQWLEMITGETVFHEEQEPDEDYLDTHYLHTAAELYDMQSQLEESGLAYRGMEGLEVDYEHGQHFDPFSEHLRGFEKPRLLHECMEPLFNLRVTRTGFTEKTLYIKNVLLHMYVAIAHVITKNVLLHAPKEVELGVEVTNLRFSLFS